MKEEEEIFNAINKDFELAIPKIISKDSIIEELEIKVSQLLHQNAESFFQFMYRLDISEKKLKAAIEQNENTVRAIASLIYDRQYEKLRSRKENKTPPPVDNDLSW